MLHLNGEAKPKFMIINCTTLNYELSNLDFGVKITYTYQIIANPIQFSRVCQCVVR